MIYTHSNAHLSDRGEEYELSTPADSVWRQEKTRNFRFVFRYCVACLSFGLIESALIGKVNKFEKGVTKGEEWMDWH